MDNSSMAVARVRLISMFFVRCANDRWTEIHNIKSEYFKRWYWGDVNQSFSNYWKKVSRRNDKHTEDAVCELVDMTDEKVKMIYFNVYNAISRSINGEDLELCTKLYIFDLFLSAGRTFAEVIGDADGVSSIERIKYEVSKFMGNFKFPYQSEDDGKRVYNSIEPYMRQFIDFLKTVSIKVK